LTGLLSSGSQFYQFVFICSITIKTQQIISAQLNSWLGLFTIGAGALRHRLFGLQYDDAG
jgi:hypothetical protein